MLQWIVESRLKKCVELELHLAGREQAVVRLGTAWVQLGSPSPLLPGVGAPLVLGNNALMSQGSVGVQHCPCTWQIRRDALCQLVLDEHLQHQQELCQQGKAFYVERL